MVQSERAPDKYVLTRLAGRLYGVPAVRVAEMIQLPRLRELPKMPPHVRGAFILRSHSVLAFDLRMLFGLETLASELDAFRDMLRQREQDHRNWLVELEASVVEEREFGLATDPHKCAFGRWYDTYETESVLIASHLAKFDQPHRKIHALAVEVRGLVAEGRTDAALRRIEETRETDLSRMIQLFAQFHELIDTTSREIVLVLSGDYDGSSAAYCVDSVEGVIDRSSLDFGADGRGDGPSRISGLDARGLTAALHRASRELVLLIEEERLPGLAAA